jgi:uncharacterized membrane protein YeaQ/YmgE (transglycosylase-associated protein family)
LAALQGPVSLVVGSVIGAVVLLTVISMLRGTVGAK